MKEAGKYFNLIICCMVVVSGLYWLIFLDQKWTGKYRFLYRAFACWWLAWVAWVPAWILSAFNVIESEHPRDIIILIFTDLNMVFLVLVYFNLTRGNQFRIIDALHRSISIIIALAVSFGVLYPYFGKFDTAMKLQLQWELCLGMVATMLLGWAFALRFNTNVVLAVGYVYGFCQPFAYKSVFEVSKNDSAQTAVAIALNDSAQTATAAAAAAAADATAGIALVVLSFVKIILATVVTYFFLQEPKTTKNLVSESGPLYQFRLFQNWSRELIAQTIILVTGFVVLLLVLMRNEISHVIERLSQVVAFYMVLIGIGKLWRYLVSKLNSQEDPRKDKFTDTPMLKEEKQTKSDKAHKAKRGD